MARPTSRRTAVRGDTSRRGCLSPVYEAGMVMQPLARRQRLIGAPAAFVGSVFDCWTRPLPELRRVGLARTARNTSCRTVGSEYSPRPTGNTGRAGAVRSNLRAGASRDLGACALGTGSRSAWGAVRVEAWRIVSSSNRSERDRRCRSAREQDRRHCFLQCRVHASGLPREIGA